MASSVIMKFNYLEKIINESYRFKELTSFVDVLYSQFIYFSESILGGDSLDSLSSGSMMSFSNKGQMASKNQVFVQREMSPSPRLSRSNSMRSSKSDKIYSALIQRVEDMENVETMDSVMAQR